MDPAWVGALVALIVAVGALAAWALRWAWRILRRVVHFLDDYSGQPARDGRPAVPGFMARLASVEDSLKHVVAETTPNGGGSMRDMVSKTNSSVARIETEQERLRALVERNKP